MAEPVSRASNDGPDWLDASLSRVVGPSWVCSGIFHVLTAFFVWQVAQSPGCRAVRGEQIGDGGRDVGIFVQSGGGNGQEGGGGDAGSPAEEPSEAMASAVGETAPEESLSDQLPVALSLPDAKSDGVLGVGAPPGFAQRAVAAAGGNVDHGGKGSGSGTGAGFGTGSGSGTGRGFGGTKMFGVAAKGRRFVYVIDRSASMDVALRAAKGELLASTRMLDQEQQFQVVFFNNLSQTLSTRHGVFHGTDADRLQMEEQISRIAAEGGTERRVALEKALEFTPDVIYFLTDSSAPMSAFDLDEVRKRNRGGAQIHCIEFGEGPEPRDARGRAATNFLHKLAAQTGGRYAYRNLMALGAPAAAN